MLTNIVKSIIISVLIIASILALLFAAQVKIISMVKDTVKEMSDHGLYVNIESTSFEWSLNPALKLNSIQISSSSLGVESTMKSVVIASDSPSDILKNLRNKINFHIYAKDVKVKDKLGIHYIDSIDANITLDHYNEKSAKIQSEIKLYDGLIMADGIYDLQLNEGYLNLKAKHINLKSFQGISTFNIKQCTIKSLSSRITIKDMPEWIDGLSIDSKSVLTDIVLVNPSWASSAIAIVHGKMAIGDMSFGSLNLDFSMHDKAIKISQLKGNGSSIDVDGTLDISKSGKLNGVIKTSALKGLSGATLLIKGNTDNPIIAPSVASITGAIIGATLTGGIAPVGGIVGAKIGSFIGGIADGSVFKD